MGRDHYSFHYKCERQREVNNLTILSLYNNSYAYTFLILHHTFAIHLKKNKINKMLFQYPFLPAASDPGANIKKVCKTDCTNCAALSNQNQNNAVQTWH